MRNVPSLETVYHDYSTKGVKFYYIYKSLAHPETNGYVAPFTKSERLLHIAEAKKKLGTQVTWICDSMSNDLKHALGNAPNSEFIIDPEGVVVRARRWSSPRDLRHDLETIIGKVDSPTRVSDLHITRLTAPDSPLKGIVPRIQLPGGMIPVKVIPNTDESTNADPFYVKLRAEIASKFFDQGMGKLYLGFFLDPLYKVHWNNRAMAIRFTIQTNDGLQVLPESGTGPAVNADADADPREFLVDVCDFYLDDFFSTPQPLHLTIHYFACDDAETFCKPVTQSYQVILERDRDGGTRRGGRGRR